MIPSLRRKSDQLAQDSTVLSEHLQLVVSLPWIIVEQENSLHKIQDKTTLHKIKRIFQQQKISFFVRWQVKLRCPLTLINLKQHLLQHL